MKDILIFSLMLSVAACSHVPSGARAPQAETKITRIIDAHVHLDAKADLEKLTDPRLRAVVAFASRTAPVPTGAASGRVKVIQCAAIVPGITTSAVEKSVKQGFTSCFKVYLGYIPKWASDPFYQPFYRLAEKLGVPVVFHTGDTYDKMAKVKYADPLTVDEIAVTYPKVTFVLAHIGNPWVASAAEVTYKNDNVFADTSALMLGNVDESSPEAVEELVVKPVRYFNLFVENPRKLLFGTDFPLVNVDAYVRAIQRAIPEKHWDDVFYANAARVFKINE